MNVKAVFLAILIIALIIEQTFALIITPLFGLFNKEKAGPVPELKEGY